MKKNGKQMKALTELILVKSTALILLLVILPSWVLSQTFSATVSRNPVGVNEQFQLSFTLNGAGASFKPPSLSEFMVLSGPNQSTSMQFINGAVSQSLTFSYILQPKKEGTFKIDAASVESGGKIVLSNILSVNVTSAGKGSTANKQQSQDDKTNISNNNIFIRVAVNKTSVYQGEAIVATYKLYTNVQVINYSINKVPAFNGFWNQDIELPKQLRLYNEVFNGVNYQVGEIKKVVLYPQQSGQLILDPMEGECIARIQVKRNRTNNPFDVFNDPFFNDPFFGSGGIRDVKFAVKSEPLRINVKELPSPAPSSFKGTVGRFRIEGTVDKTDVKTNDAVTFRMKLTGKGNIKLADAPDFEVSQDIEKYDPKISDNISVGEGGASGTRTFEYLLIPRHQGTYELGPVEFSYFDLDKKAYVTLKTPAYKLNVERGKDAGAAVSAGPKSDFRVIGRDIRFIKTNSPEFSDGLNGFYGSPLFWALAILPFAGFGMLAVYRRKHIALSADVAGTKSRKATRMARKRLEIASKLLTAGNRDGFYDEAGKALWSYISDRFKVPVSSLSREYAVEVIRRNKVSDEAINELMATIDHCEFARFARMDGQKSPDQVLNDTVKLITKIEDEIKG